MDKRMMIFAAVLILATALSFYSGSQYGMKNAASTTVTTETTASARGGAARQRGAGGGLLNGKVLSKTDTGIVILMRDGSSRIVFVSPTTEISKFVSGSVSDLNVDESVSLTGDANPDGSINARTLQIRPETGFGSGRGAQASSTPSSN